MKASISAASTSHAASARPAIERAKGLLPPRPRLEDGDRALLVDASRRRRGVIDPGGLRASGLGTQSSAIVAAWFSWSARLSVRPVISFTVSSLKSSAT